jgi:hypothetical protein
MVGSGRIRVRSEPLLLLFNKAVDLSIQLHSLLSLAPQRLGASTAANVGAARAPASAKGQGREGAPLSQTFVTVVCWFNFAQAYFVRADVTSENLCLSVGLEKYKPYQNRHFDFCGSGGRSQSFFRKSSRAVMLTSASGKAFAVSGSWTSSITASKPLKPVRGVGWFVIPLVYGP